MRRIPSSFSVALAALVAGCARSPVESFGMIGFRGMRVVFVSDSSEVQIRDESPKLQGVPVVPSPGSPDLLVRAAASQDLYGWGVDCGSEYIAKRVGWDPRMGLSHASDGWNVGDAPALRAYTRSTNTDYIVVLNRVLVRRGQLPHRVGDESPAKVSYAEVSLDISVIDAKIGRRVWRSPALGRAESLDNLSGMVPKALELAVDNFYAALPEVHRWGCKDIVDRFK